MNIIHKTAKLIKDDSNILLIPILTIFTRLVIFLFIPNIYEDAFITLRYAENLAAGNGFVYNVGEQVLGTTTPLFALILALFRVVGIPCIVSSLAMSLVAEGITSLIVYKMIYSYSRSKIAFIPSLLFVFSPSNISWAISGMETAFFACLLAISFYSLFKERYLLSLLFAFLSAILRIDGLSAVAVVTIFILFDQRPLRLKTFLIPFLIFMAWELFIFAYFDTFVPTTLRAKLVLYAGHQTSSISALMLILSKFFLKGRYLSSLPTLAFLMGMTVVFVKKLRYYPIILWFFLYYGALAYANTNVHGWYYIPPLFAYIIITGIAVITIYDYIIRKTSLRRLFLQIAMAFILLVSTAPLFISKIVQLQSEYSFKTFRTSIGKFLEQNTPKKATLYLEPIGIIGYHSRRYIYDDAGLISPQFIELNYLEQNAANRSKKIRLADPDYLILRIKYLDQFEQIAYIKENFQEIKRFEFIRDTEQLGMAVFKRI